MADCPDSSENAPGTRPFEECEQTEEILQKIFELLNGVRRELTSARVSIDEIMKIVIVKRRKFADQADKQSILRKSVTELNLSVRVMNRLRELNIKTTDELVRLTPSQLLSPAYFGIKSLHDVEYALERYGLFLGMGNNDLLGIS